MKDTVRFIIDVEITNRGDDVLLSNIIRGVAEEFGPLTDPDVGVIFREPTNTPREEFERLRRPITYDRADFENKEK